MKRFFYALLIIMTLFTPACTTTDTSVASTPHPSPIALERPKILFFWLPTGSPCKQQKKILDETLSSFQTVDLEYIDVTNEAQKKTFYQYGVRSLPTLVILNKLGEIHKQFPPGIQSKQTLIEELSKLN